MEILRSHAITTSAHYAQANSQTESMNHTIGQILHTHLLDKEQEH